MYFDINDHEFIHIDKEYAYENLLRYAKTKEFLRVLLDPSGRIVAWIYGKPGRNSHDPRLLMQQVYFASSLSGRSAVRAVVLLHEALLIEARKVGASLAISQGSHVDEKCTFVRILESAGWTRRGFLAQREVPTAAPSATLVATPFSR